MIWQSCLLIQKQSRNKIISVSKALDAPTGTRGALRSQESPFGCRDGEKQEGQHQGNSSRSSAILEAANQNKGESQIQVGSRGIVKFFLITKDSQSCFPIIFIKKLCLVKTFIGCLIARINYKNFLSNIQFSDQFTFQTSLEMEHSKRIFITGTNRGLGKTLVKLLYKSSPQLQIHISSRSAPEALAQQWSADLPGHNFRTYQIDLSSTQSIAQNAQLIKERKIELDCIVANAALGCDYGTEIPSVEIARSTLITNVSSTIDFVKQFLPALSPNGRVVLVSSYMGALDVQSEQFKARVSNPAITEQQILSIVNEYIKCAEEKQMGTFHWSAYRTSKALLNAWSRFVLPKYLKEGQSQVCLHPGWCQTDMGGKQALLTSEQGAQRIYNAVFMKETNPSKFYNETNSEKWCDYHSCQ